MSSIFYIFLNSPFFFCYFTLYNPLSSNNVGTILVIYGIDGQYHAFRNKCSYIGRRIDPVVGTATIRCCGLFRSTFDYTGNSMSGPAKEHLRVFQIRTKQCKVIIWLD